MTPEQIRLELETAEKLPAEALREAAAQADALAPEIVALLHRAAAGVYLLPRQQNLLFRGLFALAAARRSEVRQPFLAFLRQPERQLRALIGIGLAAFSTGLLLSFHDDDPEPLFLALEDRTTASGVRSALLQVLARLGWEGRIPRDRVISLLDRFDREEWAPAVDEAWMGWEDAIALLGLKTFAFRVQRGWEMGRFSINKEAGDYEEWLGRLNRAAADPQDPGPFLEINVEPVTDPAEGYARITRPLPASEDADDDDLEDEDFEDENFPSEEFGDEDFLDEDFQDEDFQDEDFQDEDSEDEESGRMPDPAKAIRLSEDEVRWLGGFLFSAHVAPDALNVEQLDGFFTALAAGPVVVPPAEYRNVLWGGNGEPRYDSAEQAQLVEDLLSRHWNTISMRLQAMFPIDPVVFPVSLEEKGRGWVEGFITGMDLCQKEWDPIFRHEAGTFVWPILSLIADDLDPEAKPITPQERAEILALLPINVMGIAAFWSSPTSRRIPVRSEKIGRNEPCPCGSGRKYKKCCGAN
jgi:uncharacterized protein